MPPYVINEDEFSNAVAGTLDIVERA